MNKRLEIKKIPLGEFIDTLVNMYNCGVDRINMIVEKGDHQDSISIIEDNGMSEKKRKPDNIVNFDDLV
jgi:hypothetical protein